MSEEKAEHDDWDASIDEMCKRENAKSRALTKGESLLLDDLVEAQYKRDEYKRLCEEILADPVWNRLPPLGPPWARFLAGFMWMPFVVVCYMVPPLTPGIILLAYIAGAVAWGAER